MKKTITILFLVSCLLLALPLINREAHAREISVKADPRTWTVDDDGPANFSSIQEAINAASPGDTVFVHEGTYYEHVVINKTITLVGEDSSFTIIDGGYTTNENVINITRANNVTVEGFTVRKSGIGYLNSGIYIDHSLGNAIINNNITCNYEGITLYSSSNNVIRGNTISNNYDCGIIYYLLSGGNMISDNTILLNTNYGILLLSSSDNVIRNNTIFLNKYGVYLAYTSSNNTIYHNNFLNNTNQASSVSESTNFWDYDNEGNYWSGYTGKDINEDGIGDAPYDINEPPNRDNYPLMGMFYDFNITSEGEIYSVTIISNSTISAFRFQTGLETGNKIIHFDATCENATVGFCRIKFPTGLMNYPYIVVLDSEEIIPKVLNVSHEEAYAYLYFTYSHKNQTITIISSKTLALYLELLGLYNALNDTYSTLLKNYNILLSNFTQLQISFGELNNSYQILSSLNSTYYVLLSNYLKLQQNLYDLNGTYYVLSRNYGVLLYNYSQLQTSFHELNVSYFEHLLDYSVLLGNYNLLLYNFTQLQVSFHDLNDSYQKHLLDYAEQMQNIRNVTYILVALTAILIAITVYLSKRAHTNVTTKIRTIE